MIFVSYRERDADLAVGRALGHLENHFHPAQLRVNADALAAGEDFIRRLETDVRRSEAFLAMIGPSWLTEEDYRGRRRIDRDNDYVVVALRTALRTRKRVIPVLVDGGELPPSNELPDPLQRLARLHPLTVRRTRFKHDMRAVVDALRDALSEASSSRLKTELVTPILPRGPEPPPPTKPPKALIDAKQSNPHALLVIGHDTIVDVVQRRHGDKLRLSSREQRNGPRTILDAEPLTVHIKPDDDD